MNAQQRLEELGLSSQESTIYLTLLAHGELPASTLAKQVSLQRTTTYAILKNMVDKGYVQSHLTRRRQVFRAEPPRALVQAYEDRLRSFTEGLPLLESLEKKHLQSAGVRFIETTKELKRFYRGILHEYRGRSYSIIGNSNVWQGIDSEFFVQFRKDRAQAGICTSILLTADSVDTSPTDANLLRQIKFLPKQYQFASTIDIFDDKILIVNPSQTALAVVIAVPTMVDVFRMLFQALWDMLSKE